MVQPIVEYIRNRNGLLLLLLFGRFIGNLCGSIGNFVRGTLPVFTFIIIIFCTPHCSRAWLLLTGFPLPSPPEVDRRIHSKNPRKLTKRKNGTIVTKRLNRQSVPWDTVLIRQQNTGCASFMNPTATEKTVVRCPIEGVRYAKDIWWEARQEENGGQMRRTKRSRF